MTMVRRHRVGALVAGLALGTALLLLGVPLAGLAQSDSGGLAIIGKLRPTVQPGGGTRGSTGPGAIPPSSGNLAPAPVWPNPKGPSNGAISWALPRPPLDALQPRGREDASLTLAIPFTPGSARLTPDCERMLRPLGEALNSPELRAYRFRIEAHTDSVGDADANMALTEQRAIAVRNHLVWVWGVDERRLIPIGFGSSQPLVPARPQVQEERNRRIQVVNLGF